jgi:hypothetical protein
MLAPLLEWFPALSGRMNISTVQGREWLPGLQHFSARIEAFPALQACLYKDEACLEDWAEKQGEAFDYVYLSLGATPRLSALAIALRQSSQVELVYDRPAVLIFKRR